MATNHYAELYSYSPNVSSGSAVSPYISGPALSQMNSAQSAANEAAKRRVLMENIEFENRQKLYDPSTWASLFGGSTSGSSGVASPYDARLTALLDNPDSIANSGAYKFRLNQGNQAIQRSAAAKGMLGSGNTLAALLEYGQGEAGQAYNDAISQLTALRGQDATLTAAREKANLDARNNFFLGLMDQTFKQADREQLRSGMYY